MSSIVDVLSGVLRFFPNTMLMTLLTVGAVTGKLSWVFVGFGGLLLAVAVLTLQYMAHRGLGLGPVVGLPGAAVLQACSMIPITEGATYSTLPSLWVALTSFFATYILVNAAYVYNAKPVHKSKEALPVQQRKGIGLISMLAAVLLFILLVVPRVTSPCETLGGTVLGLALGIGFAWVWWKILHACGSDVFPDIHGVMLGLKPGMLHTAPVACAPR